MDKGVKMNEIKKTTLHPDNQPNVDLYPKTSTDQVEGLNNIVTGINNEIEKKVNTVDNFVRIFTIPNGASSGTLTADVKEKLCNPDGHNYYVYDDTSELILKYSFNEENEIIQYKAMYLQVDKAYEIIMQILPSNGSWRRSQTVLNVPASAGENLYQHYIIMNHSVYGKSVIIFNSYRNIAFSRYDLVNYIKSFGAWGFVCKVKTNDNNDSFIYNAVVAAAGTPPGTVTFTIWYAGKNSGYGADLNESKEANEIVSDTVTEI